MGGLYGRLKTWVTTEDVTAANLNAEFDNVLNNFVPLMMDDYSVNVTQMQVKTDPGELGTESLATTLGGELARIRHMITEITGKTHWYQSPTDSLAGLAGAIGSGLSPNRLVSGKVRSTSDQPAFLTAHGAARTVTLKGATTNFLYYVEGIQYTIDADVTLTSLTAAPSSNNTCLINDAAAADQYWTTYAGEDGTEIPIDTVGSEITALVGKFAAFKLNNGSSTEYFIAKVETNKLTRARRGYFFDSSDNPVPRVTYANNDTITLLKLAWIFAKSDETLTVSYTNPVWAYEEPSSPASGDFWFDLEEEKWMKYDTSAFIDSDATLVGITCQDNTNCIGARAFEFFKSFSANNTVELAFSTNAQLQSKYPGAQLNVWGETFKYDHNQLTWDMTLDLDSGVTEGASTYYYFYVTEDGDFKISDVRPYDRREDLLGYYHPYNSWRCVGLAFNNASSNLTVVESYFKRYDNTIIRPFSAAAIIQGHERVINFTGASASYCLPDATLWTGEYTLIHSGTSLTQVYTLTTFASQTIGGIASGSYALYTNGEVLRLIPDGTNWLILDHKAETAWSAAAVPTITGSTGNPTKGTMTFDQIKWRRSGSEALIVWEYVATTASGAAGTGVYLITLPDSLSMDTGIININNATAVSGVGQGVLLGCMTGNASGGSPITGAPEAYSATQFKIGGYFAGVLGYWGSGAVPVTNTNLRIGGWLRVPITGWRP